MSFNWESVGRSWRCRDLGNTFRITDTLWEESTIVHRHMTRGCWCGALMFYLLLKNIRIVGNSRRHGIPVTSLWCIPIMVGLDSGSHTPYKRKHHISEKPAIRITPPCFVRACICVTSSYPFIPLKFGHGFCDGDYVAIVSSGGRFKLLIFPVFPFPIAYIIFSLLSFFSGWVFMLTCLNQTFLGRLCCVLEHVLVFRLRSVLFSCFLFMLGSPFRLTFGLLLSLSLLSCSFFSGGWLGFFRMGGSERSVHGGA